MIELLESRVLLSVSPALVPWARPRIGEPVDSPGPIGGGTNPTPTPAPDPLVQNGLLGGNLNFQADRVQDLPFVDLVKTTRGFYNLAGRTADNGNPEFADTDADGWPTEDFAFSAIDYSEWGEAIDAGTYRMRFTGPAGTSVSVRREGPAALGDVPDAAPLPTLSRVGYDASADVHTYDVVVPEGVIALAFDFRNTLGAVRGVKVVQPGYDLSGHPTFREEYLNLLRNLAPNVLRLSDWAHTNNNPVAEWSERTEPDDATQARTAAPGGSQPDKGIAWEYGIELANTLGTGLWVNVPARASDDYVRQLAGLLKNTLRPNLVLYVEYSNEVWNTVFNQSGYNLDRAKAEVAAGGSNLNYDGSTDPVTWADRRYARRTKEIADLFEGVWTGAGEPLPIDGRVRPILAGQVSKLSRFDNELAYLATFYGPPEEYLYGIGVAPYINLGSADERPGMTKDQVLGALSASVNNYRANGVLASAKSRASAYGLELVAYEGGIDTFGPLNVGSKKAAVLDPRIKDIMVEYLNTWYGQGGGQFVWFTLGARSYDSPYGTWAITDDIRDLDQPKEVAFRAVRDATRAVARSR